MIAHDLSNSKRSNDVKSKSGKSKDFDAFLLSAVVLKGLKECGFVRPSPIQVEAIPLAKCGIGIFFVVEFKFIYLFIYRPFNLIDYKYYGFIMISIKPKGIFLVSNSNMTVN